MSINLNRPNLFKRIRLNHKTIINSKSDSERLKMKVRTYSVIKRNETELFVVRWMDLETVIQSEVSQEEKNKYHMLTHTYGI